MDCSIAGEESPVPATKIKTLTFMVGVFVLFVRFDFEFAAIIGKIKYSLGGKFSHSFHSHLFLSLFSAARPFSFLALPFLSLAFPWHWAAFTMT